MLGEGKGRHLRSAEVDSVSQNETSHTSNTLSAHLTGETGARTVDKHTLSTTA